MALKKARARRTMTAGLAAAAALTAAAVSAAPAQAASSVDGEIVRSETLTRAQYWVNERIVYSQSRWRGDSAGRNYRTDCSGYVSLAWHLGSSLNTTGFSSWSGKTVLGSIHDLKPGDAILKSGHIELFAMWKDPNDHTDGAYVYSLNGPTDGDWAKGPIKNSHGQVGFNTWADMNTYRPIRYNKIRDDATVPVTPAEGHLYREPSGTIAVIAGGAPVRFAGMAELEAAGYGDAALTAVPAGWLNKLPQDPRNGTYLRSAADGSIYVIAGGAKYHLTPAEWNEMGKPGATNVPVRFLEEYDAAPLDGTHLRRASDGAIFLIAGGAKYHLSPAQWEALGKPASTNVPGGFIDSLSASPRPGTHLRNIADGAIHVIVGGAKYHLSPAEYEALGSPTFSNVPPEWLASFGTRPADGSYLRSPVDGAIYVTVGGAKYHLSPAEYEALGSPAFATVPTAWIDTYGSMPADGSYLRDHRDGAIWAVTGGKKRHLSLQEWTDLGKPAATNVPGAFLDQIPNA
ncbi:hypothetical protein ACTMTI_22285 [Nonomuraea sp. H19]|uniref:hypothetical protein n=1 Tax=Nonomuraea sp. H19 TaxID=3452206 RepID=UPI003F8B2451